ncbi:hypothetical protein [Pedobacter nototheniae]|uniref:hypothetical protein n=1 Tax=Pedobacter nototheniae TaxID=2488994 RepID=UPI0029308723|nr:hypothetical protein [Pedobacter nototheniae]
MKIKLFKTGITILICLLSITPFAQQKKDLLAYSLQAKTAYEDAFKKLPESYKEKLSQLEKKEDSLINKGKPTGLFNEQNKVGWSIFTKFDEIIIQGNKEKLNPGTTENLYQPDHSGAILNGDTLTIFTGVFFPRFKITTIKNKTSIVYEDWRKYDPVFQKKPTDKPDENLNLNCSIEELILSKKQISTNDIVYGKATFSTPEFYENKILKKFKFSYVFKVHIVKAERKD